MTNQISISIYTLFQQIIDIPMETNCVPFLADLFLYTASGPVWPIDVSFNCQRPIWPIDVFFNCQRADWADLLPHLTAKGPIGSISIVICIFFIK